MISNQINFLSGKFKGLAGCYSQNSDCRSGLGLRKTNFSHKPFIKNDFQTEPAGFEMRAIETET